MREFMHVDDFADAAVFLMLRYDEEGIINVGTGEEVSIRGLAEMILDIAGFKGRTVFDLTKPDGTPRKLLDTSRLKALGWSSRIPLRQGLESTYRWYAAQGNMRSQDAGSKASKEAPFQREHSRC